MAESANQSLNKAPSQGTKQWANRRTIQGHRRGINLPISNQRIRQWINQSMRRSMVKLIDPCMELLIRRFLDFASLRRSPNGSWIYALTHLSADWGIEERRKINESKNEPENRSMNQSE